MIIQRYSVNQYPIQTILTWIDSGEIAIPEIQRPFVWDSTKVRNFLDSLFNGFPVGYIIIWRNPDVKLKDGTTSFGRRIVIDGQQRISAILTAVRGKEVLDSEYNLKRIKISFHPIKRIFEVWNYAIAKDKSWFQDISEVFSPDFQLFDTVEDYLENNEGCDRNFVYQSFDLLRSILNNPIGVIELNSDLDIEVVTEIFIRINASGVILSQADFAMSKIAVNETYGGRLLRKAIDYFSHMAVHPEFYNIVVEKDKEFVETHYFKKIKWLKNELDDLYDPTYSDVLRVAFVYKFKRGKLKDLVALLSGRNFETKKYEEEISEQAFKLLEEGVLEFINESNFKNLLMVIRSAGFIDKYLIRSQNSLNFAYILYLALKDLKFSISQIESLVSKWFVMSVLTARYTGGSPESVMDNDISKIYENPLNYLEDTIKAELTDGFWEYALPQRLESTYLGSPVFSVYLAAQVKAKDKGFLSGNILVYDLVSQKGDLHHIFPKDYLKKYGYQKKEYNQLANFVITQTEINLAIGSNPPKTYMSKVLDQCNGGRIKVGSITSLEELYENLKMNCIPEDIFEMDVENYFEFLEKRRKLIAKKIRNYFSSL
ncbi:MAG: DUF262 domain-containing protein [Ignavibacteria bacterium]|nr:DUF262 domain-containing protein [Ignavibacteria bacterium]